MNDEARRCRRFGWTSLAAWALFGLALEAAHGFKLAAYLDDNLRHTILRLAHAHGVILALVVIGYGGTPDDCLGNPQRVPEPSRDGTRRAELAGSPRDGRDSDEKSRAARRTGTLLRAAALLIPVGFALGAVASHEGDPGWPVLLVPVGGALLVAGLIRAAWRAWRDR